MAARLHSVSKAADRLEIGQPTVSVHIKKLEEEFGVILFDRIKRPIQLTAAGEALARLSSPLVDGLDALLTGNVIAQQEGPVTLGAPHDIIPDLLVKPVAQFRKTHPSTPLSIRSGHRNEVLQMVRDREIDLGIVPGRDQSSDLDFTSLLPYERVLITPLGHPLLSKPVRSFAEIAAYPLVLMEKSSYTRSVLESAFRRNSLDYEIVMELQHMDSVKQYVALGMGISVGPRLALREEDSADLGVSDLSHLIPTDQIGYVSLAGRPLSRSVFNFQDILERIFRE